jgi:predicted Zn-dependent peptidase
VSLSLTTLTLPHLHSVAVSLALRGGPRYEGDTQRGLTHFLEHMIFRGAGERAGLRELMMAFEEIGGEPEAFTSEDALVVQLSVDPSRLERALELLGDVLLSPRFADLESERELILEERLERTDEDGNNADLDDLSRALAFEGHPLARSILGRKRDILACNTGSLGTWREQIVTESNAALVIAGPIEHARALAATAPLALPAGGPLRDSIPVPDQDGMRIRVQRAEGPQTDLRFSFRGPGERSDRFPALRVLADVLDGGPTGRLPERLVDSGLAYSARAALTGFPDVSLLEIDVTVAHGKLPRVVDAVFGLIGSLRAGVSDDELVRGRLRRQHALRALRDDAAAQAEDAVRSLLFDLPPDPVRCEQEDAVDAEAVVVEASRVLVPDALSVLLLGSPGKSRVKTLRRALDAWQ